MGAPGRPGQPRPGVSRLAHRTRRGRRRGPRDQGAHGGLFVPCTYTRSPAVRMAASTCCSASTATAPSMAVRRLRVEGEQDRARAGVLHPGCALRGAGPRGAVRRVAGMARTLTQAHVLARAGAGVVRRAGPGAARGGGPGRATGRAGQAARPLARTAVASAHSGVLGRVRAQPASLSAHSGSCWCAKRCRRSRSTSGLLTTPSLNTRSTTARVGMQDLRAHRAPAT